MRVKIVYNQPFLFISNTFESFRLRMNTHYISTDTIYSDTVSNDRFGMLINVSLLLIVCGYILIQNCASIVKIIYKIYYDHTRYQAQDKSSKLESRRRHSLF